MADYDLDRLKYLLSMIDIGNDSIILIQEYVNLIDRLLHQKRITKREYDILSIHLK